MRALLLTLLFLGSGCGAIRVESRAPEKPPGASRPRLPGLDVGAPPVRSLRFDVYAYGTKGSEISELLEKIYETLLRDTGLYSFRPQASHPVVVYGARSEYLARTRFPAWSQGLSVSGGIYTHEGPHLPSTLAHEVSHILFGEFMGERSRAWLWVNEGLAMHEEGRFSSGGEDGLTDRFWRETLSRGALPFAEFLVFVPASEEKRDVDRWYVQAGSIVRFLIERGGSLGFGIFLTDLKSSGDINTALAKAYPGKFENVKTLELTWKEYWGINN